MNTVPPRLGGSIKHPLLLFLLVCLLPLGRRSRLVFRDQEFVQVAPAALASQVGIVRRGYQTDRPGGARIEVARRVDALLHLVRAQLAFVIHNRVMRGLHVAL